MIAKFDFRNGARCVVRSGQQKTQHPPCQVFSCTDSAPQPPANEEKFTPAPEKNIFLTGEQNFLSEVGCKCF